MSYLKKYYIMAENELNERKRRNDEQQRANIAFAEQKSPQIKELRRRLISGGSRLASVLISEGDPRSAVQGIAEENLSIRKKIKELLISAGFKENFLNPIYSCEKCKDSGIYEGKRCSCFMELVKNFQCLDLNASSAMNLCSFASFDMRYYSDTEKAVSGKTFREEMKGNLNYCLRYCDDFHLPQNGILMVGGTGLGKTHLSLAVGNEIINKGYSVIYGSAPNLFRIVEKEHFDSTVQSDTIQLLQECDLLIIDDLGAEFESKFYLSVLYNLLNTRMNAGKPLIINTNFTLSELQNRYVGRISSRMFSMENLFFYGSDIRMIKKFSE